MGILCSGRGSGRFLGGFCSTIRISRAMRYLSQEEAVSIDQELFNEYQFSVDQLMELAGLSCAQAIHSIFPDRGPVLVIAGPGNNGGDGLVCARHLALWGFRPTILYPKPSKSELMRRLVVQTQSLPYLSELSMSPSELSRTFPLIVDAIFGFSFTPPIRSPFDGIIKTIAKCDSHVFSIDIPSGWNVDSGPPSEGDCIRPNSLMSLTAPKKCARDFHGLHFLGGRFVPPTLASKFDIDVSLYRGAEQFVRLG